LFDAKIALAVLDGKIMTYQQFNQELDEIYSREFHNLPPEFGPKELLLFMRQEGWLIEHPQPLGLIEIHIENQVPVS
jgi:hypothetical protein